jgi:hypothetical protein
MKIALYTICATAMLTGGIGCTSGGGMTAAPGGQGALVTVQYVSP